MFMCVCACVCRFRFRFKCRFRLRYSSEIQMYMIRIADHGSRTSDLGRRTSGSSFSHSASTSQSLTLSVSQPFSLSAPERIHEIVVPSCWKPTKLIRCEHYPLQHRGPPGTPHIHLQGAAGEYCRVPSRHGALVMPPDDVLITTVTIFTVNSGSA